MHIDWLINVPFASIFICMVVGMICPIIRNGRIAQLLNLGGMILVSALSLWLLISNLSNPNAFSYMVGHYPAPWGNELQAGPLEALMAFSFSIIMIFSLLGGLRDIDRDIRETRKSSYYMMMSFLFSSLLALIYTNDLFTAYVFIEISTLCACGIVMSKDSGQTVVATIRYFIMSALGSGLFLLGVCMMYGITGELLMPNMQASVIALVSSGTYLVPLTTALGLMTIGLAIKSALFPFHTWLPDAHGSSTTASSAVLSGLVLKGYIILLIKLFYRVFTPGIMESFHLTDVLFVLGALAMIMGSVRAMRETHIKRMIAYSSVAQVGYIFMGLGLSTTIGIAAACFCILAHAFTKPMLFLSAGGLVNASDHEYELKALRGSARKDPISGLGFTVGALSMVGIPLFAGFVGKAYLGLGSFDNPARVTITFVVLGLSSVLNALYYLPAVVNIWTPKTDTEVAVSANSSGTAVLTQKHKIGVLLAGSISVFIACNFILGIWFEPILKIITTGLGLLGPTAHL